MGKRFKELQAELAAKTEALADSQERHSRATALVGELKRTERERIEREREEKRQAREALGQALREKREREREAERRKQEAEELDRLRQGIVKIDQDTEVAVRKGGGRRSLTLTRDLTPNEFGALERHLQVRSGEVPSPISHWLNVWSDKLAQATSSLRDFPEGSRL